MPEGDEPRGVQADDTPSTEIEELLPEPPPSAQAHMVYVMAPWGEIIASYFSVEQWIMIHQVAEMSGRSIEDVICETIAGRYALYGLGGG